MYNITDARVDEIFATAWHSGYLAQHQCQVLRDALLRENLEASDRISIDRLLHAIRRGWLQLVK